jgi:drug/metabolite transporter (DMT)-like permease
MPPSLFVVAPPVLHYVHNIFVLDSNLAASFTLAFSCWYGLEEVTYGKVVGLVLCFAGVLLVGDQDRDDSGAHSVGGDVVALLSAMGYGLYTAVIRLKVTDFHRSRRKLF